MASYNTIEVSPLGIARIALVVLIVLAGSFGAGYVAASPSTPVDWLTSSAQTDVAGPDDGTVEASLAGTAKPESASSTTNTTAAPAREKYPPVPDLVEPNISVALHNGAIMVVVNDPASIDRIQVVNPETNTVLNAQHSVRSYNLMLPLGWSELGADCGYNTDGNTTVVAYGPRGTDSVSLNLSEYPYAEAHRVGTGDRDFQRSNVCN